MSSSARLSSAEYQSGSILSIGENHELGKFWTAAPNHKNITKTITLESTSDTQEDLDHAANRRERSDPKPSFRYTEMRPNIPEQDGTFVRARGSRP